MSRLVALGLAALSLAACSTATKFGYNHLDWLAKRQIKQYIELTPEQVDWVKPRFQTLWDWHRDTQLPLYVEDLSALAVLAERPMSAEQIAQTLARLN